MRDLAAPAFPDDDGSVDPRLASALADLAAGTGTGAALVAALRAGRLLVPVLAVLDEAGPGGGDKDSHMAAVLSTGRDGRTALLAFSCTAAMARWDPAARPVAVRGAEAAQAALAEGADALLLDLAGPQPVAVERPELDALAARLLP